MSRNEASKELDANASEDQSALSREKEVNNEARTLGNNALKVQHRRRGISSRLLSKLQQNGLTDFLFIRREIVEEPILFGKVDKQFLGSYRDYCQSVESARQEYVMNLARGLTNTGVILFVAFVTSTALLSFSNSIGLSILAQEIDGLLFSLRYFFTTFLQITIPALFAIYWISIGGQYRKASSKMRHFEETSRMQTKEESEALLLDPKYRYSKLSSRYLKLTNTAAKAFFESKERYKLSRLWSQKSAYLLTKYTTSKDGSPNILDEVQYLLDSLSELVDRERKERRVQNVYQTMNIFVIVAYIAVLIALMISAASAEDIQTINSFSVPFISVPAWALIWGAFGSLSAILYRFYNFKPNIKFSVELQWIIARPIIGVLMSAVAFLAVQTGLILLGSSRAETEAATELSIDTVTRFTSIVCFLAGFSDKFYLGVINLLVSTTIGDKKLDRNPDESSVLSEYDDFYSNVLEEEKALEDQREREANSSEDYRSRYSAGVTGVSPPGWYSPYQENVYGHPIHLNIRNETQTYENQNGSTVQNVPDSQSERGQDSDLQNRHVGDVNIHEMNIFSSESEN